MQSAEARLSVCAETVLGKVDERELHCACMPRPRHFKWFAAQDLSNCLSVDIYARTAHANFWFFIATALQS